MHNHVIGTTERGDPARRDVDGHGEQQRRRGREGHRDHLHGSLDVRDRAQHGRRRDRRRQPEPDPARRRDRGVLLRGGEGARTTPSSRAPAACRRSTTRRSAADARRASSSSPARDIRASSTCRGTSRSRNGDSARIVNLIRGISRHVVRFVEYDGALYALKELPERPARREWTLLRRLEGQGLPVVEAVGIVTGPAARPRRGADHAPPRVLAPVPRALLGPRHPRPAHAPAERARRAARAPAPARLLLGRLLALEHALPARRRRAVGVPRRRRDGRAARRALATGSARYDIEIAHVNVIGELLDVDAEVGLPAGPRSRRDRRRDRRAATRRSGPS